MAYVYKLDWNSRVNRKSCPIPAYERDRMFKDVDQVEISTEYDSLGGFLKVRPIKRSST